jgi:hypothetical protein
MNTLQTLDSVIESLTKTITVCKTSKNKSQLISSISSSTEELEAVVSHLKANEKRKFIPVRKALLAVSNVLSGMKDGLVDGTLSLPEFRKANAVLVNKFFPRIKEGLVQELESQEGEDAPVREVSIPEGVRNKIKIVISKSSDLKDAVSTVSSGTSVSYSDPISVSSSPIDALAAMARKALPLKLTGNFKIVRVPIVPLFSNPVLARPEVLNKIGLKNQSIEGFVVLMDQILMLVSKREAANMNTSTVALAHSVVDLLNERGSTKYEIVSDTPSVNPRNADLQMFWVLPRPRLSALSRVLGSAQVKWGLPLPSTQAEEDQQRISEKEKIAADIESKRQAALEEEALKREQALKAKREAKARKIAAQKAEAEQKRKEDEIQKKRLAKQETVKEKQLQSKLQQLVRKNKERHGK